MCAIAGVLNLPWEHDILNEMQATMERRGPDGKGTYQSEQCCLLHSRLAIIDPEGGKQPMRLQWAGETYVISYNGELYNTRELRSRLLVLDHRFLTDSDTEVVLHAYAQWGEQALQYMNGIFAFAVWEERAERLFLARDRMGVKPLFYCRHKGGFLFASEIKTILKYPTVQARLDATGVGELLLLGPGRTPGSGVFYGIEELEPGCCGYYYRGQWFWKRYWRLLDGEHRDSFAVTVEKVRYLVTDAIRRQMVSDVPLGTFLSGGLDSSIITAVCAEEMQKRGERLPTFSVDYVNNDRYFVPGKFQPNSDSYYISLMEKTLGTEHHWSFLTPEDLYGALEEATLARDLPGMADVDFSLLVFCKDIRREVKMALSGECADEIFGGYPWFRDPQVRAVDGFPWAQNTQVRQSLLAEPYRKLLDGDAFVRERYEATVRETDVLPGTDPEEKRMKEMVQLNYRWFMQTLLDRKDRMSMFSSLEVRVPFCDYRIAEYLYAVPWCFKDYKGREKGLLRKAVEGLLPEEVLYRKKSPYPKTFDPRYTELVTDRLRSLLQDKSAPLFQIVSRENLRKLLNEEPVWPWYGQLMRLPQTAAYMLQLDFWLRHYRVELL